jgi:hypothetical protein
VTRQVQETQKTGNSEKPNKKKKKKKNVLTEIDPLPLAS